MGDKVGTATTRQVDTRDFRWIRDALDLEQQERKGAVQEKGNEKIGKRNKSIGALSSLSRDHNGGGSPGQILFVNGNFHSATLRGSSGEILFALKRLLVADEANFHL